MARCAAAATIATALVVGAMTAGQVRAQGDDDRPRIEHVLLVSVDGMRRVRVVTSVDDRGRGGDQGSAVNWVNAGPLRTGKLL
jgi:hypothetical protein